MEWKWNSNFQDFGSLLDMFRSLWTKNNGYKHWS
jgi:hypothetical protein